MRERERESEMDDGAAACAHMDVRRGVVRGRVVLGAGSATVQTAACRRACCRDSVSRVRFASIPRKTVTDAAETRNGRVYTRLAVAPWVARTGAGGDSLNGMQWRTPAFFRRVT